MGAAGVAVTEGVVVAVCEGEEPCVDDGVAGPVDVAESVAASELEEVVVTVADTVRLSDRVPEGVTLGVCELVLVRVGLAPDDSVLVGDRVKDGVRLPVAVAELVALSLTVAELDGVTLGVPLGVPLTLPLAVCVPLAVRVPDGVPERVPLDVCVPLLVRVGLAPEDSVAVGDRV